MSSSSDLVIDSKLDTEIHPNFIHHVYHVSGSTPWERKITREERWVKGKTLGHGGFGTVWLEKCVIGDRQGTVRAVKAISKMSRPSMVVDYSRELEAMAKFSNQRYEMCFVKFFGWFENDESVFLAMEYFEQGDLQRHLTSEMKEIDAQQISKQLLEGLCFMHTNGFTHRDLKPSNIFVVCKHPWWVKIGDFGISKRVERDCSALRTMWGTPGFVAPEVYRTLFDDDDDDDNVKSRVYTNAVDMWAVGVIGYIMTANREPFPENKRLGRYSRGVESFPKEPLTARGLSTTGIEFLSSLMTPRAEDRATAKDALKHAWMQFQILGSSNKDNSNDKPFISKSSVPNKGGPYPGVTEFNEQPLPAMSYQISEASAAWSTLDNSAQLRRDSRTMSLETRVQNLVATRKQQEMDQLNVDTHRPEHVLNDTVLHRPLDNYAKKNKKKIFPFKPEENQESNRSKPQKGTLDDNLQHRPLDNDVKKNKKEVSSPKPRNNQDLNHSKPQGLWPHGAVSQPSSYYCRFNNCPYQHSLGFSSLDHLERHMENAHGMLGKTPLSTLKPASDATSSKVVPNHNRQGKSPSQVSNRTANNVSLEDHLKSFHNIKGNYSCIDASCPFRNDKRLGFSDKDTLVRHMENAHPHLKEGMESCLAHNECPYPARFWFWEPYAQQGDQNADRSPLAKSMRAVKEETKKSKRFYERMLDRVLDW